MDIKFTNPYELLFRQYQEILDEIRDLKKNYIQPKAKLPKFYQKEEIKKMTGWTDAKIYGKVHRRQLDYIKDGKRLLFPADKFHARMEQLEIKVKSPEM